MTLPILPRLDPDQPTDSPLATSEWLASNVVVDALSFQENNPDNHNPILLGYLEVEEGKVAIAHDDDRHITLIAGSRAGKGDGMVLPNLLTYYGSVICIDPKGENASVSANWRAKVLGQSVLVLDPYRVSTVSMGVRSSLNPLEYLDLRSIELIEDVGAIAEAMIVPGSGKDPHWDESARTFIKGVILFILFQAGEDLEKRSLGLVREYLTIGMQEPETEKYSFDYFLRQMTEINCPCQTVIAAAAITIMSTGENERGSILSTARRQTEFLEAAGIQDCLRTGGIDLAQIKQNPKGVSIYLVLPEWRMATHARWLRLVLNTIMQALERTPKGVHPETGKALPAVLLILEEMASLGKMTAIEKAASYIAGFGVKILFVLQDLNQLKTAYRDSWETFLANSGTLVAYGNTDVTTTEYLSKRLGVCEIKTHTEQNSTQRGNSEAPVTLMNTLKGLSQKGEVIGAIGPQGHNISSGHTVTRSQQIQKTDLMTPDEISRYFARERGCSLVLIAGANPIRVNRLSVSRDPFFHDRASPNPFHVTPKKKGPKL